MRPNRRRLTAALFACVVLVLALWSPALRAAGGVLPSALTDEQFWALSARLSEPNGTFRSDNLVSNEVWFQHVIPLLQNRTPRDGVYLGVGPEQNFTYIAALRPRIAFITDIRRGNLDLHLMYKALFELSADRAEFVSRLFNKPRPAGLTAASTAREIIDAYDTVETADATACEANLQAVDDVLVKTHHFPLGANDLDGIAYVVRAFCRYGLGINYNSSLTSGARSFVPYRDLVTETDERQVPRGYLASEENFHVVKDFEARNLVVPVVADVAGPTALRAIGDWLRDHEATVSVFYISNVEQYLTGDGVYAAFCRNVGALPLDQQSTFIRTNRMGYIRGRGGMISILGSMKLSLDRCAAEP